MTVSDFKPFDKNTLRGVFVLTLPSGMKIHGAMLHEREGRRWVGLPAVPFEKDGRKTWSRIIDFSSREIHERFQAAALEAVDRYLAGGAR